MGDRCLLGMGVPFHKSFVFNRLAGKNVRKDPKNFQKTPKKPQNKK
jgi:hypothetical protein